MWQPRKESNCHLREEARWMYPLPRTLASFRIRCGMLTSLVLLAAAAQESAGLVSTDVAERGFAPDSGGRELRRLVEREIEARLAERLLDDARPARLLRASVRMGALVVEHLERAAQLGSRDVLLYDEAAARE